LFDNLHKSKARLTPGLACGQASSYEGTYSRPGDILGLFDSGNFMLKTHKAKKLDYSTSGLSEA
jgi:hypothetical protein